MTPDYQDKGINFYCCDCIELLKEKPDNYYNLAIVDPPYTDTFRTGNWVKVCANQKKYKDVINILKGKKPDEKYFVDLFRISKNQIIWGGNYFTLPVNRCWLCWYKSKSDNYFSDFELAWTSFDKVSKMFDFLWSGMLQGNMKNKEYKIHPTQKPVALYRWLLKNYAKPGDRIFDSHGGSMSSAIACALDGFEMDICEIDREYFDMAVKRFKESTCQMKLF